MKIQSVRGMNDIVAPESTAWQKVEAAARKICKNWGYSEVRTPIVEPTALFQRGVGEATDIVEKEMYTFDDRNGESLTLRPEGTAGVVRACIQHGWTVQASILKLFYIGAMYRHERPQKGRYRQFHQFGIECFGVTNPRADAEVIALGWEFLNELGIKDLELRVSTLGSEECREPYRQKLSKILHQNTHRIPQDFLSRIDKNPQRIFDHKAEELQSWVHELPLLINELDQFSQDHFEAVKTYLKGMSVPFVIDPKIVRGLDYYGHTAFEFVSGQLGRTQNAVGGGGRYDGLFEKLGGRATPAVGFGIGLERVLMLLGEPVDTTRPDVYVAIPSEENSNNTAGEAMGLKIASEIRRNGFFVELDLDGRSMKGQMKRAIKLNPRFMIILGAQEIESQRAGVKDMDQQTQIDVPLNEVAEYIIKKIK